MGLLLFLLLFGGMNADFGNLHHFDDYDLLHHVIGDAILTLPSSERCIGVDVSFTAKVDEFSRVRYTGYDGGNATRAVRKALKEFCETLTLEDSLKYNRIPNLYKHFEHIEVGGEMDKPTDLYEKNLYEYEDDDDFLLLERPPINIKHVFSDFYKQRFSSIITKDRIDKIITDFLAYHVEDSAVREYPFKNPFAGVTTFLPAKCNSEKTELNLIMCFPMLDFDNWGHIVEIVHKGAFITVNGMQMYAQIDVPRYVFMHNKNGQIFPIDASMCRLHNKKDFSCAHAAILKDAKCRPPFLTNCSVTFFDSRMPSKIRQFGDQYLLRSFKPDIETVCENSSNSIEFATPANVLWKPTDPACYFVLNEETEISTFSGKSHMKNLTLTNSIVVDPKLLSDYFFVDHHNATPSLRKNYKSVWQHQLKTLEVINFVPGVVTVGEKSEVIDYSWIIESTTTANFISDENVTTKSIVDLGTQNVSVDSTNENFTSAEFLSTNDTSELILAIESVKSVNESAAPSNSEPAQCSSHCELISAVSVVLNVIVVAVFIIMAYRSPTHRRIPQDI